MIFLTRRTLSTLAGIALFVPVVTQADTTEIILGFDGLPEWSLDVGDFGVTFTGAAVLTCGGSLNCGPFPPSSGDNVIFDNFDSDGVIKATFDIAKTGSVSQVSARVTGNTNITITAFDSAGNILDTDETGGANYVGSDSSIPANKLLTLASNTIPIDRVEFSDSGNTFTVDDFAFLGSFRKVVVDPGHGKIDGQYQRSPSANLGIIEDQLTLDMGKSLASFLDSQGVTVILTREGDSAPFASPDCVPGRVCVIDLIKRTRFAEIQEADILVSIHTNAADAATANGTETFYRPSAPSDTERSRSLAHNIHENLVFLWLRDRGVKTEDFAVLSSSVVSALTEVAFHSNTELAQNQTTTDEELLGSQTFRDDAATSIGNGILNYFEDIEAQP